MCGDSVQNIFRLDCRYDIIKAIGTILKYGFNTHVYICSIRWLSVPSVAGIAHSGQMYHEPTQFPPRIVLMHKLYTEAHFLPWVTLC